MDEHPFRQILRIQCACDVFEEAPKEDGIISIDGVHLAPGMIFTTFGNEYMEIFAKSMIFISDSTTCTAEENPDNPDEIQENWYREEMWDELQKYDFEACGGRYFPIWGPGSSTIVWRLEEEYKKYADLNNINVVVAGNDIWKGREYCKYWLDEFKKWNANIYSCIPEYAYSHDPDDPNKTQATNDENTESQNSEDKTVDIQENTTNKNQGDKNINEKKWRTDEVIGENKIIFDENVEKEFQIFKRIQLEQNPVTVPNGNVENGWNGIKQYAEEMHAGADHALRIRFQNIKEEEGIQLKKLREQRRAETLEKIIDKMCEKGENHLTSSARLKATEKFIITDFAKPKIGNKEKKTNKKRNRNKIEPNANCAADEHSVEINEDNLEISNEEDKNKIVEENIDGYADMPPLAEENDSELEQEEVKHNEDSDESDVEDESHITVFHLAQALDSASANTNANEVTTEEEEKIDIVAGRTILLEQKIEREKKREDRWNRANAILYARKQSINQTGTHWRYWGGKYWGNEFWRTYDMEDKEIENVEKKLGIHKDQIRRRQEIYDNIDVKTPLEWDIDEKKFNQAMKIENENLLSPFYIENEDEVKIYEISMEYQDGYKAISILIDSGASDSVAPPGLFPEIPVYETNASRGGLEYTAAGGQNIPNLGMCRPIIYRTDGSAMTMSFQVAGVSKALGAVSRIVGSGSRVVFDHPSDGGPYIENKSTGKVTPLRQYNGAYYLDVWYKPGDELKQGFPRQGP